MSADSGAPTLDDFNEALAEAGRERGFCLCIRPMMTVIDFAGLTCSWCGQVVPAHATSPEMKALRTHELTTRRPDWVKR